MGLMMGAERSGDDAETQLHKAYDRQQWMGCVKRPCLSRGMDFHPAIPDGFRIKSFGRNQLAARLHFLLNMFLCLKEIRKPV